MRTPIIAGNWKMNKLPEEAASLAEQVVQGSAAYDKVEIVLAPTNVCLHAVKAKLDGSAVGLSAQNVHFEASGAYTGEVSPQMLKACGCGYVILGHSERRQLFGETDEGVHRKLWACLREGLTPIVCVGESLEERKANHTKNKVSFQVRAALTGLTAQQVKSVVIAYEPIWAIGTGLTATPEQAQEVHAQLRQLLTEMFGQEAAQAVRIQYGGSVKPDNIVALIAQPDIDGALVGGASLKAADFLALVKAAQEQATSAS